MFDLLPDIDTPGVTKVRLGTYVFEVPVVGRGKRT